MNKLSFAITFAIIIIMHPSLFSMALAVTKVQSSEGQDAWTPLHEAASKNNSQEIERLLAEGAKKDAEDDKGRTPLFIAAGLGNKDAVQILCERKAHVNHKEDEFGMTPLHVACWKGFSEVASRLLEHKARINEEEKFGKTPLHVASNAEVIRILLENKASLTQKDKKGFTAFEAASNAGNREIVKAFLSEAPELRKVADDGTTALHRVAQAGATPEIIKVVLAHGGDIWARDGNGMIPLHRASAAGRRVAVQSLLALDPAQVNAVDGKNKTPIHYATMNGHEEIAKLLRENSAHAVLMSSNSEKSLSQVINPRPQQSNSQALTQTSQKKDKEEASSLYPPTIKMTQDVEPYYQKESPRNSLVPLEQIQAKNPPQVLPNGTSNILHKLLIQVLEKNTGFEDVKKLIDEVVAQKTFSLDDLNEDGLNPLMIACGGYKIYYAWRKKEYNSDFTAVAININPYLLSFANLALAEYLLSSGASANVSNSEGLTPLTCLLANINVSRVQVLDKIAEHSWDGSAYNSSERIPGVTMVRPYDKHCDRWCWGDLLWSPGLDKKIYCTPECALCIAFSALTPFGWITWCCVPVVFVCNDYRDWKIVHDASEIKEPLLSANSQLYELIKALIKNGAEINHVDKNRIPTLEWAIKMNDGETNNAETIGILLKNGAQLNVMLQDGESLLMKAVRSANFQIIKILCENGASINAATPTKTTALHIAVDKQLEEIASYLIKNGAEPNIVDSDGRNSLMLACLRSHLPLFSLLLPLTNNLEQTSQDGDTALTLVCKAKPENIPLLTMLVEAGADSTKVLPSIYLELSADAKYVLSQAKAKNAASAHASGYNNSSRYAQFEAEARLKEQREHMERMQEQRAALAREQINAQNRATNAHAAANVISVARLGVNLLDNYNY